MAFTGNCFDGDVTLEDAEGSSTNQISGMDPRDTSCSNLHFASLDVIPHESHDFGSAILNRNFCDDDVTEALPVIPVAFPFHNVDVDTVSQDQVRTPASGECSGSDSVEFCTSVVDDISSMTIFTDCINGVCHCRHLVGDAPAQLKPCRAAQFLFGPNALTSISDDEGLFLWQGLVQGFKIVDPDCRASYSCSNYDSITGDVFKDEMTDLLLSELDSSKVTKAASPPQCIHSLGAVRKSNGRLRPITDCSRPDGASINNYMLSTFRSFNYNSVDTAVQLLAPLDYMSVVDIASAYRSVNVHSSQVKFQGITWDFGDGDEVLLDHRPPLRT